MNYSIGNSATYPKKFGPENTVSASFILRASKLVQNKPSTVHPILDGTGEDKTHSRK